MAIVAVGGGEAGNDGGVHYHLAASDISAPDHQVLADTGGPDILSFA